MKAKFLLTSASVILAFVLSIFPAQADSRTVKVQSFTKIKASTGITVVYEEGSLKPVQITATPQHINNIIIENDGESLLVYYRSSENSISIKSGDIEVRVTAPKVKSFIATSGAGIIIKNDLNRSSGAINANSTSGGEIEFKNITASSINLSASSGASISAESIKSSTGNVTANSGSDISIENMDASTANVSAQSAGEISFASMKASTLNIDAFSASKVRISHVKAYQGNVNTTSTSKVVMSGKIDTKIFEADSLSTIKYDDSH